MNNDDVLAVEVAKWDGLAGQEDSEASSEKRSPILRSSFVIGCCIIKTSMPD